MLTFLGWLIAMPFVLPVIVLKVLFYSLAG